MRNSRYFVHNTTHYVARYMSWFWIIVVIVVAFVIGYFAVSWFIGLNIVARNQSHKGNGQEESDPDDDTKKGEKTSSANANSHGREESFRGTTARTEVDKERAYGRLLGLKGVITKQEVRKRYVEAMTRYHPDKVNHLAPEFQAMAEEKTKALTEAYDYFRRKYDLR